MAITYWPKGKKKMTSCHGLPCIQGHKTQSIKLMKQAELRKLPFFQLLRSRVWLKASDAPSYVNAPENPTSSQLQHRMKKIVRFFSSVDLEHKLTGVFSCKVHESVLPIWYSLNRQLSSWWNHPPRNSLIMKHERYLLAILLPEANALGPTDCPVQGSPAQIKRNAGSCPLCIERAPLVEWQ